MGDNAPPHVTVLVPTFRGGELAGRCVASILACDYPEFDVIALDQTPEDEPWMTSITDSRFSLVRLTKRGKSAALNCGIQISNATVIAFTDQDCIVPPDWIASGGRQLLDSGAALLFASVEAPPHDRRVELIPARRVNRPELRQGRLATAELCGLGANLFALRESLVTLGGLDESMGPGHRFPSGEDQDLYNRALRAGMVCAQRPEPTVLHLGSRLVATGHEAANLREYSRGIGALASKDLRLGDLPAMYHPFRELASEARGHLLHLVRPTQHRRQAVRFPSLVRGFVQGMRTPLDRRRKMMVDARSGTGG